jgi:HD-GYP domain-containing protein (c-di-GMP phosphodiesterase class II)
MTRPECSKAGDRIRSPNPLKKSIDRILLVRMGLAASAIGLLFGAVAFFSERGRLESEVADFARVQVERFSFQSRTVLDAPRLDGDVLQSALTAFSRASGGATLSDGSFVTAKIYDPAGDLLAESVDTEYRHITAVEEILESIPHDRPADQLERVVSARISGAPHIGVVLPLKNSDGTAVAHIEGVFAVSEAGVAAIRVRVVRSVTIVFLLVLLTTAVIYPVISSLVGRLARTTTSLLDSNLETLQVLGSAIAKRDSDTDAHNYRVTVYAVRLAEEVGVDREEIRSLIKGSLLHDVGKIGIRDAILLKPGRLTDDEFEVMKTHVNHGLDITARSSWLEDARGVVGFHHERFDGAGYPRGLRGQEIPPSARIFAIVDVFDALTSSRPYKEAFSFEETIVILDQGSGSHFDPSFLDAFRRIARDLYDEFAGLENDAPRRELHTITERYFAKNARELFA